jgi:fructosamine-3-kinase
VREDVEDALGRLGHAARIQEVAPLSGGCINHGARLTVEGGACFFLKWNSNAPPSFFDAEADGLRALAAARSVRVPEPVARGGRSGAPAWLLLEYIPAGEPAADFSDILGRGLARLHASAPPGTPYGWSRGNWIGSLPQSNRTSRSWAAFWREERLAPQLSRARDRGLLRGTRTGVLDRVLELVPAALADVDHGPVHLLHGDLWSGNAYAGPEGEPVVIDPAVYHGHGEVDLAMAELFGGFGARFFEAYAGVGTITAAYAAYRRDLYQLYYLLVHVNLFGVQYEERTLAAAARAAAALSG